MWHLPRTGILSIVFHLTPVCVVCVFCVCVWFYCVVFFVLCCVVFGFVWYLVAVAFHIRIHL